MIRYDVLWHDLVRDLNESRMHYEKTAQELDKMNANDLALTNRRISACIENNIIRTQREFDYMKERDEEVEGSAVTLLQKVLQELKKMNERKEEQHG